MSAPVTCTVINKYDFLTSEKKMLSFTLHRHIFTKLAQIYPWDNLKCWLHIGDLDPIVKVKILSQLTKFLHFLSFRKKKKRNMSWANKWIFIRLAVIYHCDKFKTCLIFGDLDPIFKVRLLNFFQDHSLECRISFEPVERCCSNVHKYII